MKRKTFKQVFKKNKCRVIHSHVMDHNTTNPGLHSSGNFFEQTLPSMFCDFLFPGMQILMSLEIFTSHRGEEQAAITSCNSFESISFQHIVSRLSPGWTKIPFYKNELPNLQNEYMIYGGYPDVVLKPD